MLGGNDCPSAKALGYCQEKIDVASAAVRDSARILLRDDCPGAEALGYCQKKGSRRRDCTLSGFTSAGRQFATKIRIALPAGPGSW